jgi:hypothetical protein
MASIMVACLRYHRSGRHDLPALVVLPARLVSALQSAWPGWGRLWIIRHDFQQRITPLTGM